MARTVLLADDSVTAQNMGRRILMDAGYEVITVNNGSAALKKIHESKPDLIVLDVYMPGYGGLEVCQRLKETAETMRIPVLLTVGKMEPFKTDEARRVRADAHIVKPFDASELLAALTKLEDRIVPQPESNGKRSKPKKARSWHASEDPAANFDDSNTDQIAYLADVKQRQSESKSVERSSAETPNDEPAQAASSAEQSASAPTAEETPSTFASVSAPMGVPEFVAEPAPEFSVEEEPQSEFSETVPAEGAFSVPAAEETDQETRSTASSDAAPAAESKSRWIAENVALTPEEAALELDREMRQAQQIPEPAPDATPAATAQAAEHSVPSEAAIVESPAQSSSPREEHGTAFAAAASANGSSSVEAVATPAESQAEPPAGADAAAAWENWQHIRDSVMGPQTTAALAESVVEMAQAVAPVEEPPVTSSEAAIAPSIPETASPQSDTQSAAVEAAEASAESTPNASLEGEALSSIVDSVLAELKPKLMQEIAKKLKK